jgi:hypothetical protein
MALSYSHGAIQWLAADAATTVYTVSGLSFQPKALKLFWQGLASATDTTSETANIRRGVGFGTSTSDRRCVAVLSADAGTAAVTATAAYDSAIVAVIGDAVDDGLLDLNSITSDGFTLIVDDQIAADITVFWEAWGGSDITVATTVRIEEPGATGNQDYTVTGFSSTDSDDQVVMIAGVRAVNLNSPDAQDSSLSIGFATGGSDSENVVVLGGSDDGSATMDTGGYCKTGEVLAGFANGVGGVIQSRAKMTQFNTDGFRLNWLAVGTTGREQICLAIKGGSWRAGSYTIDASALNATATVSGLSFAPVGLSLISRGASENAAGVASVNDRISMGCGSSTSSRRCMGNIDEDSTANAEIDLAIEYDQVLVRPTTSGGGVATAFDINAMNSDGFQIIVDVALSPVTEWNGYLTFGDAGAAPSTFVRDMIMAGFIPFAR